MSELERWQEAIEAYTEAIRHKALLVPGIALLAVVMGVVDRMKLRLKLGQGSWQRQCLRLLFRQLDMGNSG
ncbi:MAG: hypothetical protein QF530_13625 [SAR202 cluster bacterium]|nr:hypothetical protein [SAR202 cluster bacterium]